MSMRVFFMWIAALAAGNALAADQPTKPEKHEFAAGQVWTFHLDPKEPAATLTVLRVETLEGTGEVVHVSVSAVRTANGVTSILQLPFSRVALDRSVVKLVRTETGPLDLSGFDAWKAASDRSVFTTSVNEALAQIRKWSRPVAADAPCTFDRAQLLGSSEHDFDQDMEGGWRKLAMRDKCRSDAADLIRDYREMHKPESPLLFWHEGQLRADLGQTDAAIRLFQLSRHPADSVTGWNEYVDASVAFLRKDRAAFDKARAALAARSQSQPSDMNLRVVDELGRCFGLPYQQSYGHCRK